MNHGDAHGQVTRSFGLLERFLAKKRATMANSLIPDSERHGKILDIGCGTTPYFLSHTFFKEKFGIDPQLKAPKVGDGISLQRFDVEEGQPLPFPDNFFDVITMLAVFEHIRQPVLPALVSEVRRVLKPGGLFILTTPCPWTDIILRTMARLRLVSAEEMEEHEGAYNHATIRRYLTLGGFKDEDITLGYFELFLNNWGTARKQK